MRYKLSIQRNFKGIGLIELLISFAIAVIGIVGFIYGLVVCFDLAQLSKESLLALHQASLKMEEIREHPFSNVYAYYNNQTFEVSVLPAGTSKGSVRIDNSNPKLLTAYISISWVSAGGRPIGEDVNLDGQLSVSEDLNNNAKIDSPVTLTSYIARH